MSYAPLHVLFQVGYFFSSRPSSALPSAQKAVNAEHANTEIQDGLFVVPTILGLRK